MIGRWRWRLTARSTGCRRAAKNGTRRRLGAGRLAFPMTISAACLTWVLVMSAARAACAEPELTAGVQPREVVLDNGLILLLVERHEQPTVSCGVFYDVGAVNDPAGKSGIAHLFEHMLFKGTRILGTTNYQAERPYIEQQDALRSEMTVEMNKMRVMKRHGKIDDVLDPGQWTAAYRSSKKQYDELVEAERAFIINNEVFNLYTTNGGAGLNAGTTSDVTMYFVQLPANKLELFFWIEADRMAGGIMREFYVERFNVREERRLRVESTPTGKYNEAFEALFWQSHPYGVPVLGWASEVESITRDDVRDFYKIYYAPNNARVVLVGDFDADAVISMAKRYFGPTPRGEHEPPPVLTEEPKPIAHRTLVADVEANSSVRIRYHTVAIGHTDEPALDVLSGLLSGKTGRLYKRLVTTEDASIGQPSGRHQSRKYAGFFELAATVKDGHTPADVERMLMEEVDKLREGDIAERELQKVKNQVLAGSVRQLRSNFGLMFQLGLYDTFYDWTYINESPRLMLQVTADEVRRVVNKYFDHETRSVAVFRTKGGATSDDPELAAILAELPEERKSQFKAMAERIDRMTDPQQLETTIAQLSQGIASDLMPEEQKAPLAFMLKRMKARLSELKTNRKESD